jgi:tRNA (cytidine/uridine-2'-O-)-methyltransferase
MAYVASGESDAAEVLEELSESQPGDMMMQQGRDEGFRIRDPQPEWGTEADDTMHLVLVEPEIPGNTGNIARLCAGADIWLHLVRPLGFELDNSYLSRAGLDYWPHVNLCVHDGFEQIEQIFPDERLHLFTKTAETVYTQMSVQQGMVLVFGREADGLEASVLARHPDRQYRIPINDKVRSLNLANACSVATYEALRQMNWRWLETPGRHG